MNNTLLHVSTFKMPTPGSSLCLAKITYRFLGFGKIKLLKYKSINFNKMSTVQLNKFINLYFNNFILLRSKNLCVILARHNARPEDDVLNVETCRARYS